MIKKGDKVHLNFKCFKRWSQLVFNTTPLPSNILQHPFIVQAVFENHAMLESVKTGESLEIPLAFIYPIQ